MAAKHRKRPPPDATPQTNRGWLTLALYIIALVFILFFANRLSEGTANCFFQASGTPAPQNDTLRQDIDMKPEKSTGIGNNITQ